MSNSQNEDVVVANVANVATTEEDKDAKHKPHFESDSEDEKEKQDGSSNSNNNNTRDVAVGNEITEKDFQDATSLVNAYGPLMRLHYDEEFFPCTVEYYESHAEFEHPPAKEKFPKPFQNCELKLKWKATKKEDIDKVLKGEHPVNGQCLSNCYVNIIQKSEDLLYLQFWFLFTNNGPLTNNDLLDRLGFGGIHEGDWEHLLIEVKKVPNSPAHTFHPDHWKPYRVYFSQHGDGEWRLFDTLQHHESHVEAYCARHSHASYPFVNPNTRDLSIKRGLLPNDHCSASGSKWHIWEHFKLVAISDPKDNKIHWNESVCPNNSLFRKKFRWGTSTTVMKGARTGNSATSPIMKKAAWFGRYENTETAKPDEKHNGFMGLFK